jgi:hypothetical protein
MRKFVIVLAATIACGTLAAARQDPTPTATDTVRFAVIGDNGTGKTAQYEVGRQMAAAHATRPFDIVLMLGDNMYGRQEPADFVEKFERPYAPLLERGVTFYAALGNHDKPSNRFYRGFNMGGERYYTFARKHVRFFVFDTNLMDRAQVGWIEDVLQHSEEPWKVAYFHHPLYSDAGRHGSNVELRVILEPLLVRHGVNVVFSGHEHVYERLTPQKGITYFIEGASGQLRKGDMEPSDTTAAAFDQDQTFMVVEISGDTLSFLTISRTGRIVDSGVIRRQPTVS